MIKQISYFAVIISIFFNLKLVAQPTKTYMPGEVVIKVERPFNQIKKIN